MAHLTTVTVPSAVDDTPSAHNINDGKPQATTALAIENGGTYPADDAAAAERIARSPAASTTPRRSIASLYFPSAAPAYDVSPTPTPLQGAPPRFPPPPAFTTTASPSGVPVLGPYSRGSSRRSSVVADRVSVLERRAAEAQAALEMTTQLAAEVIVVEEQISRVERELEDVQRMVASGGSYRGKEGKALAAEEERLARKEMFLWEKEGQLREEKRLVLMRSRSDQHQRFGSEVAVAARQRRVALVVTRAHPKDSKQERQAQERLSHIEEAEHRRQSISSVALSERFVNGGGGAELLDDHSSVQVIYKPEEDPRLVVRMEAFHLPVLVGTLLSGFTLVLFDVATTDLARRLAVLAFALEISSSTVLCWIMFHGQQLYSRSSDMDAKTRPFLKKTSTARVLSLAMFSLGVATFVASFLVEASDEVGYLWLVIFAVILCPTVLAASLFAASTAKLRRDTLTPQQRAPGPAE